MSEEKVELSRCYAFRNGSRLLIFMDKDNEGGGIGRMMLNGPNTKCFVCMQHRIKNLFLRIDSLGDMSRMDN